jgi:hypothetical protein
MPRRNSRWAAGCGHAHRSGGGSPPRHSAVPAPRSASASRHRAPAVRRCAAPPRGIALPRRTACPRQPARGPPSPGSTRGSWAMAPLPTAGTCRPRGPPPLSPAQQRAPPTSLAVRCPPNVPTPAPPADAGDAGQGSPHRGSRHHRPPGRGRIRWWHPPQASRAPARRRHCLFSPDQVRDGAAPWSGTSPRCGPRIKSGAGSRSAEHAARHRPRRSACSSLR